jgi:hypothetical protein
MSHDNSNTSTTTTGNTTPAPMTTLHSVTVDKTTGLLFEPTSCLRKHLMQQEMEMPDRKPIATIAMNEAEIRWESKEIN